MRVLTKTAIVTLSFVIVLTGCQSKKESALSTSVTHSGIFYVDSAASLSSVLLEELGLTNMVELELADISIHYGFSADYLSDMSAFTSLQEGNVDEIAVFQIKDEQNRQHAFDAIVDKLRAKSQAFKEINVKEYNKFTSSSVTINDDYIVVAVCAVPDKAYHIIDEFYQVETVEEKT